MGITLAGFAAVGSRGYLQSIPENDEVSGLPRNAGGQGSSCGWEIKPGSMFCIQ